MRIGEGWWYVFPRKVVAAAIFALAFVPDLPRRPWRWVSVGAVAAVAIAQAGIVASEWSRFQPHAAAFRQVTREIPQAPKLAYIIEDVSGYSRVEPPFLHLPAWVQAGKGGWLSWHFALFDVLPVRYREGSAEVPPPASFHFPREPDSFDVATRGAFFDWFLVRSPESPAARFAGDPSNRARDGRGELVAVRTDRRAPGLNRFPWNPVIDLC